MNFLGQLGLNYGTMQNSMAAMQKAQLANQLAQQGVTSGQNTLEGQALAGQMLPSFLGAQALPPGMAPAMAAASTPGMPAPQQPQVMAPQPAQDPTLALFGASPTPVGGFTDTLRAANAQPAQAVLPIAATAPAQPSPVAIPGAERNAQLGQLLAQQGGDYSPAARLAAAQHIMTMMNPQDRLANQQLLQDMRNEVAMQRIQNASEMNNARLAAMLQATGMRTDATTRGQDIRNPNSDLAGLKFEADQAAKNHRAMVNMYSFNPTPENAAKVEAARIQAADAMQNYRSTISQGGAYQAPPAAATGGAATATAPVTRISVMKDGQEFTIPESQLKDAEAQGYKRK